MARPRSEDKRNAIRAAAARVFAERGLGASTSAISSAAGVAEGTLFTYFKTKDELVNDLYRELKLELADVMMSGFPRKKALRTRIEHIWGSYVDWGVANPISRKVLTQLETSYQLSVEAKTAGAAPFVEIQAMVDEAFIQHLFHQLPQELVAAALRSLAEAAMDLTISNPDQAVRYREAGFGIFWSGVTKKR